MLTILQPNPRDLGMHRRTEKIVNRTLDKIRISASGIMVASGLAGLMYTYAHSTKKKDKDGHEGDNKTDRFGCCI